MKKLLPIFILIFAVSVHAATYTVTRSDDRNAVCISGVDCSLREAVNAANSTVGADTITFAFTSPTIINLTIEQLFISSDISIIGTGARNLTVQRSMDAGTPNFRIFFVAGGTANFSGITISNGNTRRDGFYYNVGGGGIFVLRSGTLNINEVALVNNTAEAPPNMSFVHVGGGIENQGTLNVKNSIFSGNISDGGGGIDNTNQAHVSNSTFSNNTGFNGGGIRQGGSFGITPRLTLNNVTITNNIAYQVGGGISIEDPSAYIRNTIIAQNTVIQSGFNAYSDVAGSGIDITSLGNNLIGIYFDYFPVKSFINGVNGDKVGTLTTPLDPKLGALQNNGGQTDTYALLPDSPAIDAGNNCVVTASCPSNNPFQPLTTDQRGEGFLRFVGTSVDIGAFELQVIDTDGDAVPDTTDNCPNTPNPNQANNDGDAQGDACDLDDDNDGVADTQDAFPFNPNESVDTDGDGTGNNADTDDDNDGQSDAAEIACGSNPLDAASRCAAPPTRPPTNKEQCKNGGWMTFTVPRTFRNQGDCIQFVNTGR